MTICTLALVFSLLKTTISLIKQDLNTYSHSGHFMTPGTAIFNLYKFFSDHKMNFIHPYSVKKKEGNPQTTNFTREENKRFLRKTFLFITNERFQVSDQ
jgi:hypothetical protein